MTTTKTIRTMCPMNCHPTLCGMRVTVNDEQLLKIEGDPDNPDSRGFLCLRGKAAREIIGNPQRLLHPLVRSKRGTDTWQQVSWDEALHRICEKLSDIPPAEFGIWLGHGDAATNYGTRIGGLLSRRFAHLHGSQWWHPAMICWGLGGFGLGLTGVLEVNTKEDLSAHSNLIILWGANIASQPNTAPHLKAAKRRGARVILIEVRDSEAKALADQVIHIKPGTDAALALSMMHVLINENLVDHEHVTQHTVGFDTLQTHVQSYTPEWGAAQTNLDAEVIVELAREYGNTRQAMILLGGSSMHKSRNGWQAARAVACLPALTGKLGRPGGGLGPRHGAMAHGQALNSILPEQGNTCESVIPNQMSAMTEAFCEGKLKALLLSGTNMLSSFADSEKLAQGLDKIDLIVCHDLFSSDTIRQVADIVLPATAWLEQLGCKMTNTHLYLMDQVLPAPGETHTLSSLLRDLSTRLGVEDFFPWESDEGMIDTVINHASTDHATVADLRAEDEKRTLRISHHAYPDHRYPTPSGKVEFYSQQAEALGLPPLPVYEPLTICEGYPLLFRQGRTLTHFHSFYDHGQALPTLRKHESSPFLWMSPEDAETRSVAHQAAIRIFNERGSFAAHAYVTDKIQQGTVWMHDGWAGINRLTSGAASLPDSAVDLFPFGVGQAAFDAAVEVEPLRA
jgi:anaerobic selenocysteine-containing dehydrogenase